VGVYCNGKEKKIKLYEEAIGEILVLDSGSEASDIDDYFEKEEEEDQQQHHKQLQKQASAEFKTGCNKLQITNLGTA
jgi:hypothetical protein